LLYLLDLILFLVWFCPSLRLDLLIVTGVWRRQLLSRLKLRLWSSWLCSIFKYMFWGIRCCTHALTFSIDDGCLYVDLKLLVNYFVSSF
jgi:hypothetical protein